MTYGDLNRLPFEISEQCPDMSKDSPTLKASQHLGQITKAHFRNKSGTLVQLFYISDKSEQILVATLGIDESVSLDTIEGHVFVAVDPTSGRLLLRHTVGLFHFGDLPNIESIDCEDDQYQPLKRDYDGPPLECGFISKGFVNLSKCMINVFYFNGSGEHLLMQLSPLQYESKLRLEDFSFAESFHYEAVYLTHHFFARLPSGKLLQEKKVGPVIIPSCQSPSRASPSFGEDDITKEGQLTFQNIVRKEIGGEKSSVSPSSALIETANKSAASLITRMNHSSEHTSETLNCLREGQYFPPLVLNMKDYFVPQGTAADEL